MKKVIENSKKMIQESTAQSKLELEKMKIELEAKSRLFATTMGLVSYQKYSSI